MILQNLPGWSEKKSSSFFKKVFCIDLEISKQWFCRSFLQKIILIINKMAIGDILNTYNYFYGKMYHSFRQVFCWNFLACFFMQDFFLRKKMPEFVNFPLIYFAEGVSKIYLGMPQMSMTDKYVVSFLASITITKSLRIICLRILWISLMYLSFIPLSYFVTIMRQYWLWGQQVYLRLLTLMKGSLIKYWSTKWTGNRGGQAV